MNPNDHETKYSVGTSTTILSDTITKGIKEYSNKYTASTAELDYYRVGMMEGIDGGIIDLGARVVIIIQLLVLAALMTPTLDMNFKRFFRLISLMFLFYTAGGALS